MVINTVHFLQSSTLHFGSRVLEANQQNIWDLSQTLIPIPCSTAKKRGACEHAVLRSSHLPIVSIQTMADQILDQVRNVAEGQIASPQAESLDARRRR
jgi:hypothetical protein